MRLSKDKQIHTLYSPSQNKPMHVVVFGSGLGTNLEALIRAQGELKNSSGTPLFEIKALFTDCKCRLHEIAERERIPLIYHSFVDFFKKSGTTSKDDPAMREAYDKKNVALLNKCARDNGFSVDLIFLAGYMRLLHSPLLEAYKYKILNVHPADLTILDGEGRRQYVGANAIYEALMNGETRTRSSVILIDADVDTGPIIVSGPWINYTEGYPVTIKRAESHQDKQKFVSDWRACIEAVRLISEGKIGIDESRTVYVNEIPQPDGGYFLDPP